MIPSTTVYSIPILETQLGPPVKLPQVTFPSLCHSYLYYGFTFYYSQAFLYYICMYSNPSLPVNHSILVNSLTVCCFPLNIIFASLIQEYILTLIDSFFTDVCITFGGHTTIYVLIPLLITFHFSGYLLEPTVKL